jgi:hypothetical protein
MSCISLHLINLAKYFDISDSIPRRGGRQITRANQPRKRQNSIFVLSIFGQFDFKLKSETRFHAQHILPRAIDKLTDDHVAAIYEAYQADLYLSLDDFRREVASWLTHWVITKRNDLPTTLCTTLDSVNPVLYPSIDTILIKLCVLFTKRYCRKVILVLRCLKNYVRSTMKNDRLSSHGLVHIHRDFEVDLYKAMEVFVSAKTRRADY